MLYLDPRTLSPDPTFARRGRPLPGNRLGLDIHPHALVSPVVTRGPLAAWARKLNLHQPHPALSLPVTESNLRQLTVDFGTELEAELEIVFSAAGPCTVCVLFGESELEVTGVALPTIVPGVPSPVEHRHYDSSGEHLARFAARGFRYARIVFPDAQRTLTIRRIVARAVFACREQVGSFTCDEPLLQRLWHTSLYTARLCTRTDAYWDGIKRDRIGWYGDARITQRTMDSAFVNATPAEQMLLAMPVDSWANQIPTYSFDGIAMFRQLLLQYGPTRHCADIYRRMRAMLRWAERTQMNRDGFFVRNDDVQYFFGIGFIDWSPMPMGGRFEEVSWMQFRWLEALRMASQVALWLGHREDAREWQAIADRLAPRLLKQFYRPGRGFVHTLNRTSRAWEKNEPNRHYHSSYVERVRLGESGPSRHANSLAVFAGLASTPAHYRDVLRVLDNARIPPVITPFFAWYEQTARAACGDPAGALNRMLLYVGKQVVENDSATVWESFEPEVAGFRRWSLGSWAKSLCHGWSSGLVPLVRRHLVGIRPLTPRFDMVDLNPSHDLPWCFEAVVPTPHGPIRVSRTRKDAPVRYQIPGGITVSGSPGVRVVRS
jgi:alpha-L-rhamnosidase